MNCAIKLPNLEAVKEAQSKRADLLADIAECELGIELTLDMPWPQSVWQERLLTGEIQRLREEIRILGREAA